MTPTLPAHTPQQLTITLIADTTTLTAHKPFIEQLLEGHGDIIFCHWRTLGKQVCCMLTLSGSWEQIAKIELQLKRYVKTPGLILHLERSRLAEDNRIHHHAYDLASLSKPEDNPTYDFYAFFVENDVTIIDLQNQLIHNALGYQVRRVTMQLAVPHDTHLVALHEAVNDILDDHNADGRLQIVR